MRETTLSRAIHFLEERPNTWYTSRRIAENLLKKYPKIYFHKSITCDDSSNLKDELLKQMTAEVSSCLNTHYNTKTPNECKIFIEKLSPRKFQYKFKAIKKIESPTPIREELEQDITQQTINELFERLATNFKLLGKSEIIVEKKIDNINFLLELNIN